MVELLKNKEFSFKIRIKEVSKEERKTLEKKIFSLFLTSSSGAVSSLNKEGLLEVSILDWKDSEGYL